MLLSRLKLTTTALLIATLLSAASSAEQLARADETPAQRAATLVQQLGDPAFNVREKATRELLKIGQAALPALREAAKGTDIEIQRRAEQILKQIGDSDLQTRLKAFEDDKEGKQEHDLPGWKRYRKLAGDDAAARALFVDMFKTNRELMERADEDPKNLPKLVGGRCQILVNGVAAVGGGRRFAPMTAGDLATLVFLTAATDPASSIEVRNQMFRILTWNGAPKIVRESAESAPIRKLITAFLSQYDDAPQAGRCLSYAMEADLKDYGLKQAVKLTKAKKLLPTPLLAIGQWGTKEHLPLLEACLDNKTHLGTMSSNRVTSTIKVCDVALVMLLRLTGQKTKDYGFTYYGRDLDAAPITSATSAGFTDEAKRAAAIKKYRATKK